MKLSRMSDFEPWFQRLILSRCAAMLERGGSKTAIVAFWRSKGLALTPRHLAAMFPPLRIPGKPQTAA